MSTGKHQRRHHHHHHHHHHRHNFHHHLHHHHHHHHHQQHRQHRHHRHRSSSCGMGVSSGGPVGRWTSTLILVILVALLAKSLPSESPAAAGQVVTMLSKSQIKRVQSGKDVTMECEFHMEGYEVFSNPIIWEKKQLSDKSRINIQGVIQKPYAVSKRFSLSFSAGQSNCYTVKLVIKDVRLEDAGNYTCEVRGKRSTVLSHVTHVLYVDGVLYSLRIYYTSTSTSNHRNDTSKPPPASITVTENEAKIFQCISNSTCPAPAVTFHLGKFDLSSAPQWSQERSSMSGQPGLRMMFCTVTRWLKLTLRERDDNEILRCSVESGLHEANWTDLLINVYYAPIILCQPAAAKLGDVNVTLECSVRARPDLGTLYWVIDSNGTTMTSNEKNNDYTILVRVRSDNVLVIQLILAYVRPNSFRKYHIEARNAIGSANNSILLERHVTTGLPMHRGDSFKNPMAQSSSSRLFNNRNNERSHKHRFPSYSSSSSSSSPDERLYPMIFLILFRVATTSHRAVQV